MKNILNIALSLLILASCQTKDQSKKDKKADKPEEAKVVKVLTLDYVKVNKTIDYTGTLMAFKEVHLSPATPGKINKINVEISDKVKKGELLVEMDNTKLQQAKVQLNSLSADMKRFEELKKTNSIAPQKYDQIKAQYDVAKNNVEFLEKNTLIKAPFSGVISGKYYENGEMFSGAPNPLTGKAAVVTLSQISKLKILIAVSEAYYPLISKKTQAEIHSDIFPNQNFEAKVSNIYPTIDPMSRTFNVEFIINNTKDLLRPGMFVKANVNVKETKALMLPDYAILKMQGSNDRYLFVNKDGIAKRINVKIGNRYNEKVEVLSDELHQGDQVIITGQAKLFDGDKLNVVMN